jgi:hypothetical protein
MLSHTTARFALAALTLLSTGLFAGCRAQRGLPECRDHLKQLRWALYWRMGSGDTYVPELSRLTNEASAVLFTCPATGRPPGNVTNTDAWTDYVYFANQHDVPPFKIPLLICPPENHGGRFGLVLWKNGGVDQLSPASIRALIKTPWCMETDASPNLIAFEKDVINVRVPPRLRKEYQDAYSPRR